MKKLILMIMAAILAMSLIACGTTKTTETAEDTSADETVELEAEKYVGTYSGEKYIDAMSCDIAIDITLNEDGTFSFYRAPMVIDMEGGGEMPELTDEGTFVCEEADVVFTGAEIGEFTMTFSITDGVSGLHGDVPTGGPSTEMTLTRAAE